MKTHEGAHFEHFAKLQAQAAFAKIYAVGSDRRWRMEQIHMTSRRQCAATKLASFLDGEGMKDHDQVLL